MLSDKREELKEEWANGNFVAAFTIEMAVKNAGAAAVANFCKDLIEIDSDSPSLEIKV